MDYEKKYNEALERAKDYFKANQRIGELEENDMLSDIFPELKESEDERIRKGLIEYFKDFRLGTFAYLEPKKIIAWLERQGEQIPANSAKTCKIEPKPADKVEPKFHVGVWITNSIETVQITGYDIDYGYQVDYKGNLQHRDTDIIEKEYHLWTIADAKDGDVLCTYECGEPKIVFILRGTPKKHYALSYHCYYNIMYPHFGSDSEKGCLAPNDEDVKPATKEQRDLLFQKMSDAGYAFDFDKKEMMKIEQKPAENEELTEFDKAVGVSIGTWNPKSPEQIQSVKAVSKKLLKLAKKQINDEQKPVEWSKDDEQYLLVCKNALSKYQVSDKWDAGIISRWLEERLKSLRPQNTWKPSDEQIKVLHDVAAYIDNSIYPNQKDILVNLYLQLNKLREK